MTCKHEVASLLNFGFGSISSISQVSLVSTPQFPCHTAFNLSLLFTQVLKEKLVIQSSITKEQQNRHNRTTLILAQPFRYRLQYKQWILQHNTEQPLLARVSMELSSSVGSRKVDDWNRAPHWAQVVTKDVIS